MITKTADEWFDAYGVSHQNPINKLIHWFCVPLIYWVMLGLIWTIPTPGWMQSYAWLNWGSLGSLFIVGFYIRLSPLLSIGMILFNVLCCITLMWYEMSIKFPLWQACILGFIGLWILQFIGHKIEGAKPSFLNDMQFLLIGPAWLMGFIYRRLGIPYH